jgi:hypothetical protein
MGYRSDVAYTIRFKDEESYRLFILEAKALDLGRCFTDNESHWDEAVCNDTQFRIDFAVNDVKWLTSYPDVDRHSQLIELAGDWAAGDTDRGLKDEVTGHNAYRIGYAFVRVGEDFSDVEEAYGGYGEYDWLSVRREIVAG